jgi:hypothetical protein
MKLMLKTLIIFAFLAVAALFAYYLTWPKAK